MANGGGSPVPAPPATPGRYGLLVSASVVDAEGDSGRWQAGGIKYEPECPSAPLLYNPCATISKGQLSDDGNADNVEAEPFVVVAEDRCSVKGQRDYEGRARRALLATQGYGIEREFWTGAIASTEPDPLESNQFLASGEVVDIITEDGPVDVLTALACTEQALAECLFGRRATIHAQPQVVTRWISDRVVRREGGVLVTELGTIVVPGAGYPGTNPDGIDRTDLGESWIYGTGPVAIRLGEIVINPMVDRDNNTRVTTAEREVVVSHDGCCVVGASVEIETCAGIGGS